MLYLLKMFWSRHCCNH